MWNKDEVKHRRASVRTRQYSAPTDRTKKIGNEKKESNKQRNFLKSTTTIVSKVFSFLKGALGNPYLLANTLITLITGIGIVGVLLISGSPALLQRILSGEDLAMILGIVTCTALLTGSMATFVFAELRRQKTINEGVVKKLSLISENLDGIGFEVTLNTDEIRSVSAQLPSGLNPNRSTSFRQKNKPEVWSKLLPGSTYTTVNSIAQIDIKQYPDSAGNIRFELNKERVARWLPRTLSGTKVNIEHVFLLSNSEIENLDNDLPNSPKRVISAYMGLEAIAEANQLSKWFDLASIRMSLVRSDYPLSRAFFIGVKQGGGVDALKVPFVYRYDVCATIPNLPKGFFDTTIEPTYDDEEIQNYQKEARAYIEQADRTLTMAEAIEKYRNVIPPLDDFDPKLSIEALRKIGVPARILQKTSSQTENTVSEIFDHYDGSFNI